MPRYKLKPKAIKYLADTLDKDGEYNITINEVKKVSGKTWTKDQEKVITEMQASIKENKLAVESLRKEMNSRIDAFESNIMNIFKLNGFKMK